MRIFSRFKIKVLLTSTLLTGLSCGSSDKAKAPFKAKVVVSTKNGSQVAVVTFNSLKDAEHLDGDLLQFLGNSKINASISGDVVAKNPTDLYLKRGESVTLDYTLEKGVIKPLSFDSLAMLTAYYHFEKILEFWRDSMGLDLADYGKFRVLYDPDIQARGNGGDIVETVKINAAFVSFTRDFLLFKTSRAEQLPLKMNMGVLAHEFAHGIFDYQFAKKDGLAYQTENGKAATQLSGINEGLADYYSWTITQRVDVLGESLSSLAEERKLPVKWTSKNLLDNPDQCQGGFYCKGSVLASALYEIADAKAVGAVPLGLLVYEALDTFRQDWNEHKEEDTFDYYYLIRRIIEKSDMQKQSYCEVFLKWFDDEVNSKEIKKSCGI